MKKILRVFKRASDGCLFTTRLIFKKGISNSDPWCIGEKKKRKKEESDINFCTKKEWNAPLCVYLYPRGYLAIFSKLHSKSHCELLYFIISHFRPVSVFILGEWWNFVVIESRKWTQREAGGRLRLSANFDDAFWRIMRPDEILIARSIGKYFGVDWKQCIWWLMEAVVSVYYVHYTHG